MLAATKAGVCSLVNTFMTSFPPVVVRDVAEGTMAFHFEKPAGGWTLRAGFQLKPGQFVRLTLLNPREMDAEGNARTFSIASAPLEEDISFRCAKTFGYSCRTTLRSELLIWSPPLYLMKPSFLNLFMKKLTRERVVPTISASVSCDTFGSNRWG
jgi:hypothetical protein